MHQYLTNALAIILIFFYRAVRVRLGKITQENLTRYLIFNLLFGVIAILLMLYQEEGIALLIITYIYIETLFMAIKFAIKSIINNVNSRYKNIREKAKQSINIKKDGDGYKLTLSWRPLQIFLFFRNIYYVILIAFYKTTNYLHKYLSFIPGDHDKVAGIPKSTINKLIRNINISAKKEKIKYKVEKLYFDAEYIDFTIHIRSKKTNKWLNKFEANFQKSTRLTDFYIRKTATKPLTIHIIIPRSALI